MAPSSSQIRVGNAPVSWGIYGPKDPVVPYPRFLDAMVSAGYAGTELGPYGYFPTDPAALKKELSSRNLALGSSYVGVPLEDASKREATINECLTVAALLSTQGVGEVIVADDDHDERMKMAGRVPADGSAGWSTVAWTEAAKTLNEIGRALRSKYNMRVVVHHHVGTMIETPAEIDRMLDLTDPELVNLLLDTGHYVYGGGDPVALVKTKAARLKYVHFKDVKKSELDHVRGSNVHMREAWKRGVFCPLGQGVVDFPRLVEALRSANYAGWAIVEQDVVADANGKLTPDPLECAIASRKYLTQSVGL